MPRWVPLFALILALGGCGRQCDRHIASEPVAAPAAGETAADEMQHPIAPGSENARAADAAADNGSASFCTPEWFAWVQAQLASRQNGDLAQLYPSGLPPVGSSEWFEAVTTLTGANLDGTVPGSTAWCEAIQKRLSANGTEAP
ncbi:hypothetical protein [Microbulbifer spongiae]|uniref:Lipoprotein n=1 Tax=Microbulbifer spongiae TaxID=2944933 RepID=A0ABY9EGM6_9GAMM|nr:hypothetical protein [Microbulbifer sp. MI-G]WKD50570.1 hypothetical protein M8T91_03850 [Microbulbifer sp. MI-G]